MIPQLIYIIVGISLLPFLPLLYIQGKRVKMGMIELPPASGDLSGQIGEHKQKKCNLLVLGESSIAGVGVNTHLDGITGNIAKHLHQHTGATIHWSVVAKAGYTVEMIRKKLIIQSPAKKMDIIVLGIGANDAFHLYSPNRWNKSLSSLLQRIRMKYPSTPIVIASLPPIGQFPAFPFFMRTVLGLLMNLFRKETLKIPQKFANVYFMSNKVRVEDWLSEDAKNIHDLFADGVHPSAFAYTLWGKHIADFIVEQKILTK